MKIIDNGPAPRPAAATPQWQLTFTWIFCGAEGLRTGWKVLLFIGIMAVFYLASQLLLDRIAPVPAGGTPSLHVQLIRRSVYALLVVADVWIMARIEGRPLRAYGYAGKGALTWLLSGAGWSFLGM